MAPRPELPEGVDNPYECIGVKREATKKQIRTAYRKKALELHPDKNLDDSEDAVVQFHRLQKAFEFLQDENKRLQFDEYLKAVEERAKRYEAMNVEKKKFADRLQKREAEAEAATAKSKGMKTQEEKARMQTASYLQRELEKRQPPKPEKRPQPYVVFGGSSQECKRAKAAAKSENFLGFEEDTLELLRRAVRAIDGRAHTLWDRPRLKSSSKDR